MPLLKRRYIFEADDDNEAQANNAQGDEQSSADNAENGSDNDTSNDDNSSDDENNEEENTDEDTSDEDEDNADDEDYSIDADPDEEDDSGDEDEDSEDNSDSDEEEEDTESDEEKQMDRDMFSTLSEEEQKRKIATLKRLFIDLYSKADSLIEKFNEVGTIDDENFAPIVKRILNILYDMKEYVSYYVLNIFDSSSYIENDITFNRYLAVLNGIKLAVDELLQERKEEEAKKNKIQTSET